MHTSKRERQRAILRLLGERQLATQGELVEALRAEGIEAVQATVSRDIAELELVKVRGADGRLVYAPQGAPDRRRRAALAAALDRWLVSSEATGGLVVLRTDPGHANALALALDRAAVPEVAGCVAGDDTIFVAAREGTSGARLARLLVGG